MSSTTKKTIIDPKSRKIADELETTADLYRGLAEYERQLKEEDNLKKQRLARQMYEIGDEMVSEIKEKENINNIKKAEIIEELYKLSKEELITIKEANEMSIEELNPILFKAKDLNKPWYIKFLDFLMGWD